MKKFIKENIKPLIFMIILIIVVNVELPYYIEAPGGTINLTERIDENYNKKNGSLNMLYVTEYKGNIVTVLLSKIIKTWDLYEISNQQVSDEDAKDIYIRNKVMLENSIQNATLVAYKEANKKIEIKETKNIVIATTKDNGIEIGDEIIEVDNTPVIDITTIKKYLETKKENDIVKIKIKRNGKTKEIPITLDKTKVIGIAMITNYEYETEDELNINFKSGEGGSSGGLVLALGIYSEITGTDLLKGRNVAGTGTIDALGNVGEIDGVKYKIAGAVKNKMDVILVSPYNYEEAKKVIKENNYKIELVKVSTFKEAIEYLTK
ncbi:MAG: PDZ domain-containing protein [bacterium]|nr:PDZ domain-containing protein [bacterium]